MHNLAIHLQKMGHEVHVITWWGNWVQVRGKLPYPVHPLLPRSYTEKDRQRLEGRGEWRGWVARQVLFYQRLLNFDVVQFHMAGPLGSLCAQPLSQAGIPTVMRCTGGDLLYDPVLRYGARCNPILGKANADAILACDQVTASSRLMEAGYLEIGVSPERIKRIPNGVDVGGINRIAPPEKQLRKSIGIPPDAFLVLTIGRNNVAKGYHFIPRILRSLQISGMDPWWVVIGAETDLLQPLAVQEGVETRLRTILTIGAPGGQEWCQRLCHLPPVEIVQWYKTADLYVHPGILEAFGNIVVESMAAGLPLVVTDGTGSVDCVKKAQCGLVARKGDVPDIADKIQQVLADPYLRKNMATRALAGAKEYDWPIIARQYAEVYKKAIRNKRA